MGFSALLARLLVHCVLACTGPVAVRVAVSLAVEHRRREACYSLTAVPEALIISMLVPCPTWMDS
jgi:hypothetical protein